MEPIGLLQQQGTVLSDVEQHGYTRILGITEGAGYRLLLPSARFRVVHRSAWKPELFSSALQAGPGIIEQGKLDISERDLTRARYFRSFVAACGNDTLIGASLVPTHLYTLGGALVEFLAESDLTCPEVVNLAGDREAVLLVRHKNNGAFLGNPEPRKASLIGFRRR